jgi:hypothetical protein
MQKILMTNKQKSFERQFHHLGGRVSVAVFSLPVLPVKFQARPTTLAHLHHFEIGLRKKGNVTVINFECP